jgi:hypothetical protein
VACPGRPTPSPLPEGGLSLLCNVSHRRSPASQMRHCEGLWLHSSCQRTCWPILPAKMENATALVAFWVLCSVFYCSGSGGLIWHDFERVVVWGFVLGALFSRQQRRHFDVRGTDLSHSVSLNHALCVFVADCSTVCHFRDERSSISGKHSAALAGFGSGLHRPSQLARSDRPMAKDRWVGSR